MVIPTYREGFEKPKSPTQNPFRNESEVAISDTSSKFFIPIYPNINDVEAIVK